jgi:hypothetical protein
MMGLGYIVDPDKAGKALATVTANNHAKVAGGAAIEVWPAESGRPERVGDCWPHYTEAYYAALAIYESQKDAGLGQIHKLWRAMNGCHARWDSGLGMGGPQNEQVGGRWYMTNTASWFDLLAIAGVWVDLPGREFLLAPNLPPELGDRLSGIPVLAERFSAAVDFAQGDGLQTASFRITRFAGAPMEFDFLKTRAPRGAAPKSVSLSVNGAAVPSPKWEWHPDNGYVVIRERFTFSAAGDSIEVRVDL